MNREERAAIKRKEKEQQYKELTDRIVYYRHQGYVFREVAEKVGKSERATRMHYDRRMNDPAFKTRRNAVIELSKNWIEQTGRAI